MDQNFQICDRCKEPSAEAVIECKECALMIYSKDGDEFQAMRVCEHCDRLIHDISYKKHHRRTNLQNGETIITQQSSPPHVTIKLTEPEMSQRSHRRLEETGNLLASPFTPSGFDDSLPLYTGFMQQLRVRPQG